MRQAREILREYRERKKAEAIGRSSEALREENLRRMLRHVGAAHQPSERFEDRLLRAMLRTGSELGARRGRSRLRLSPPAWPLWAPAAAALAASALVFATQLHRSHLPTPPAHLAAAPPLPTPSRPTSAPVAQHTPPIGLVIMGELQRQRQGEKDWEPVGSDAPIYLGDEVRTDAGTSASVVFLDSSVSHLRPNTTLRYAGAARAGQARPSLLLLTRGETWNTVEKGGPPFMVRTSSATATVWGTEFGVAVDRKGKTTLRVKEGKVELAAARASEFVTAGMEAIALPGHAPEPPVSMTPHGPPHGKPEAGAVHTTPVGASPTPGPPDQSHSTIHRLPPAESSPASTDAAPPGAPVDSSGAPQPSGDSDSPPRQPVSTSR